jgi:hypothetical protein
MLAFNRSMSASLSSLLLPWEHRRGAVMLQVRDGNLPMTPEQIRSWLLAMRKTVERTLRQIDGVLATLEEEPEEQPQPQGCPHSRLADIGTLGNRGARLCLDCNQEV